MDYIALAIHPFLGNVTLCGIGRSFYNNKCGSTTTQRATRSVYIAYYIGYLVYKMTYLLKRESNWVLYIDYIALAIVPSWAE